MAAQADVLGGVSGDPVRRAQALELLSVAAQGNPRVLEAVAGAVVNLPPSVARGLLLTLSQQRDAGVMAALLEALTLHVQHARAIPHAQLEALLEAPFRTPGGSALEAQVHATTLARLLGRAPPGAIDANSPRALLDAAHLDAGQAREQTAPALIPPARLRFRTDAGEFELTLEPAQAPRAVATILAAVAANRYAGLTFHRVVPGFVAQGGDPRGDGFGGTDEPVTTELSLRRFERGAVGIPLAGLDTGGMQLFITLADAPWLDARYPWIGTVTRGIEVVDALLVGDRIRSVEVIAADR
jgi:cyclophilin family peptidyl-prolyl cis-trans isomerase